MTHVCSARQISFYHLLLLQRIYIYILLIKYLQILTLKDQDANLLSTGYLNQRTGAGIVNISNFAVARLNPGEGITTAPIIVKIPESAPYRVIIEAEIENTYYHYNKPDQVTAPGMKQNIEETISETTYRAFAAPEHLFYPAVQPVVITGQAINNTTGTPMPDGPVKIGISVKGFDRYFSAVTDNGGNFLAHISGSYFAALAPLQSGTNNIRATAKDLQGVQRDATVSVNATPGAESVLLTSTTPNADFPTLKASGLTTLDVTLKAIPYLNNPVAKYSWDFNGDGVTDLECNSLSTVTASFKDIGIYLPTVTVTDTEGKTYSDTTIVNVLDKDDDSIFKVIWNRTKTALAKQDIEGALKNMSDSSQETFRFNFELLRDHLPEVSARMLDITKVKREEDHAEFELSKIEDGEETSYHVEFVKDADGVWRLSFF